MFRAELQNHYVINCPHTKIKRQTSHKEDQWCRLTCGNIHKTLFNVIANYVLEEHGSVPTVRLPLVEGKITVLGSPLGNRDWEGDVKMENNKNGCLRNDSNWEDSLKWDTGMGYIIEKKNWKDTTCSTLIPSLSLERHRNWPSSFHSLLGICKVLIIMKL